MMVKRAGKILVRGLSSVLPLGFRKRLVCWLDGKTRSRLSAKFSLAILSDWRVRDPKAFHKFFWTQHLYEYGRPYESLELFEFDKMEPSRRLFLSDLRSALAQLDIPEEDRNLSVLELGCSMGYLIRNVELEVLPAAKRLVGVDLDPKAIELGKAYLAAVGSDVVLLQGDIEEQDDLLGKERFDVSILAGVLSYLDEKDARTVLGKLLARTDRLVAFAGLADRSCDNRNLEKSLESPERYNQWVHNVDAIVQELGGEVIRRRWEGAKLFNGQTVYFVFAVPRTGEALCDGTDEDGVAAAA